MPLTQLFAPLVARAVEAETTLNYSFPGLPQTISGPATYIDTIFKFGLGIVGLIALGFIVYGGLEHIIYAGNPSRISEARKHIIESFVGIVLLLSAYIILKEINPKLVKLQDPTLTALKPRVAIDVAALEAIKNRFLAAKTTEERVTIYKEAKRSSGDSQQQARAKLKMVLEATTNNLSLDDTMALFRKLNHDEQIGLLMDSATESVPTALITENLTDEELLNLTDASKNQRLLRYIPGQQTTLYQNIVNNGITPAQQKMLYNAYYTAGGFPLVHNYLSNLDGPGLTNLYTAEKQQNRGGDFVYNGIFRAKEEFGDLKGAARAVVDIWRNLPEGERKVFLGQVKGAGYNPSLNTFFGLGGNQDALRSALNNNADEILKFQKDTP